MRSVFFFFYSFSVLFTFSLLDNDTM